ncbi:Nuclear receptor coactivator 5 [Frankliniella fusca]|uniref:Nuclear receptor coactivator 5 n=1 Tax=Frankliniella fusca TaxID=407009 RepID=A0AAE1HQ76_9NEOP|nr:Nuclear receptor coactivator 5 [Frankliniella fusca]KAK3924735.1 Nuclear receptor coactivator 5 [Frankliniella fusca]
MSGFATDSSTFQERLNMKDPSTASSRIFVGSIPHENVGRQDIEDAFSRFGKVTGVLLNRGFGFVQFENERSAIDAINEPDIIFKGRRLDVKQARVFNKTGRDVRDERDRDNYWDDRDRERDRERDRDYREDREREPYRDRSPLEDRSRDRRDDRDWRPRERDRFDNFSKTTTERDRFYDTPRDRYREIDYRDRPAERFSAPVYRAEVIDSRSLPIQTPGMDRTNDCEIIVINKKQTRYAEFVEEKLKKLGLTVDILYPNEDVQMSRVLGNISSRGTLYAIMIEPINEDHDSLTVNILHGTPEAHRNMPLKDAISLITRNFDDYKQSNRNDKGSTAGRPAPVPVVPIPVVGPASLVQEKHPDPIQALLKLLADNCPLTVLQYDKVISYLTSKRELQVRIELGESDANSTPLPVASRESPTVDKQAELQNRIMSILSAKSAPSSAPSKPTASVPPPAPVPAPSLPNTVSSGVSAASTLASVIAASAPAPVSTGAWNPPKPQTDSATPILSDPNVQKALDSLMQGNLLQRLVGSSSNVTSGSSTITTSSNSAPSGPLFNTYGNSASNSNHVGGRRF